MPDGIDLKRIIDLDPETTVTDDDYTIVDSTTGGAKKFAIGQALGEIKDGLDAMSTATASDVGKALKAKTVSDGKVTEWEFGEAGGNSVPIEVRQAMVTLFNTAIYAEQGMENEIAIIENWANVSVESITLSPSTLTFNSITSQTIQATLTPPDATATIIWTSSNPSVATVSNGTVTSVGNGTCTITASVGDVSATCAVTVSGIATTYTITNTLTGCTNTNSQTNVEENTSYTATITVDDGYMLPFVSATITMGGTDITSTAWNDGTISIASVTGAIVITVSATQDTRTYIAKWDFTKSLVDSVGGLEMVLKNTNNGESLPTRDSTGLHFTAGEQLAHCADYAGTLADGRTYEFDVASAEFAGDSSKHKRLFGFVGGDFLMIYRNSGAMQIYKGAWITYTPESGKTIPTTTDALSGKTVGVKLGTDKTAYLYLNGELIGKSINWTAAGNARSDIGFGGIDGQTASAGNQIHNMTITGFRIYEEEEAQA